MKANNKSGGTLSTYGRRMLAMQGFGNVSEERLKALRPWLRVAPGLTAAWMLLGTVLQSPLTLWVLVPFAVLGALLPVHPFDVFYNHIARHVLGGPVIPSSPIQRRLCCAVASGWAILTAILLQSGYPVAATWTGLFATLGCVLPAITEFCIPSFVIRLLGGECETCELPLEGNETMGTLPWWASIDWIDEEPVARTLYVSRNRTPVHDEA